METTYCKSRLVPSLLRHNRALRLEHFMALSWGQPAWYGRWARALATAGARSIVVFWDRFRGEPFWQRESQDFAARMVRVDVFRFSNDLHPAIRLKTSTQRGASRSQNLPITI